MIRVAIVAVVIAALLTAYAALDGRDTIPWWDSPLPAPTTETT